MSARMLRRALRERESQIDEDEEQDDAATAGTTKESAGPSIFSLLAAQDGENEEEEEVEQQEEAEEAPAISKPDANLGEKNKSKNKTKKKKKNKSKKNDASSKLETDKEEGSDEILSKLLQNVSVQQQEMDRRAAVISVDAKDLRPKEELRLIFGSKAIHSVEKSARQRQGRLSAPRSGRKCLVVPMGNWPRWDGGVSMELVHTKDGVMTFRYVYSADYLEVQKAFEACVSSHDPNKIASLLLAHPYHADSLLALADVYKHIGEHQQAATLLERCLYALECAWSPLFDPLAGKSRLDYSCKENRPLFSALFSYMQHLGRRGCHRTAMEFCKVLLSLDLDDPTGARFCIDYYALRAGQYSWLEAFVESFYDDQSVALLPNFSFSLAVARYYLEQKEEAAPNPISETVPSSDLLQQALMLHPSVLSKIVARAPIKEDAAWSKVLKHRHFARATSGGPSLEHLINIYIERNYLIWRVPELQAWLKDAAVAVCEARGGESATWACARAEAFQADHNEYQHLSVSEFSDRTPTLPPDEEAGAAGGGPNVEVPLDVPLVDRNAFAVFVESVFPWMNYGGGANAGAAEEDSD
ncbi:transcription factor 25 [Selaginella moellendorffii]|uniref:transcription factor 25 n=1 Tax=Selaginella moellendorffii TaxID=88036 RepID=UPI000D1CD1F3|nr:transcription factor 25 [Selaginella moellendorffii]|eukprot:XP_024517556.1 transcription factor 25 [Selaginella moellendorffii]